MYDEKKWEDAGNGGYDQEGPYQKLPPYGNRSEPYGFGNGMEDGNDKRPVSGREVRRRRVSPAAIAGAVILLAVVFGAVAGGTMFLVYQGASAYWAQLDTEGHGEETGLADSQTGGSHIFDAQQSTDAKETSGAAGSAGTQAAAADPSGELPEGSVILEDVSPIVEEAMPSVVSITNTVFYQRYGWFGGTQTYEIPSSGSGIIIGQNDTELLIVTNNHVINDADSLTVTFMDESSVQAAIKGTDAATDLAIIAVQLSDISADTKSHIKAAALGDSDALKMGQGVIAIGNALGHGQSVTVGHVSALDREIQVDGAVKKVIQVDAAINPGNSGGALLNSRGEVIGINEAKYADENVEGVGYAIPISHARDIIDELMTRTTKIEVAESEQGYLGIQVQNIDETISRLYGMPQGVYVYKIPEDSAAAGSGLREKDIITELDGEEIRTYADLNRLLTYYKAGSQITFTVQSLEHGEYAEREVAVTLTGQ